MISTPLENNAIRISLSQKPVNSLNLPLISELNRAVQEANSSNCSAIILSSSCRVFSAGLDLNCLYGASPQALIEYWTEFQNLCFSLYGSEKFVIAEIGGHAPAAGTILSICCDYRVAVSGVKLGLNEAAFGLVCPIWACDMMTSLVGPRVAYQALCQGSLYPAEEALQMGFVDRVVDGNSLQENVQNEIKEWCKHPGRGPTKSLLRRAMLNKWIRERQDDLDEFVSLVSKEETQQRIGAYLQSLKK